VPVATWLTSGWIDVAMILGWWALVVAVGLRVWRAQDEAEQARAAAADDERPGAAHRALGWLVALRAIPTALRRSRRG
jgi:hypothetical protein